ncbi:MAG: tetratricopeptide repeat protein, partial [Alphaproteobacteria bacterium]|nr:tetratricopeptide repeat protein [Alphaproteobacteria bacterium]
LDETPVLSRFMLGGFGDFFSNIESARQSAYLVDAELSFLIRRFDQAADLCRRELALHPNNIDACRLLGRSLIELGQYEEGVRALEKAARASPRDSASFVYLAEGLKAQGRLDESLACAREAVRLGPNSVPARGILLSTLAYMPPKDWQAYSDEARAAAVAFAAESASATLASVADAGTIGKDRADNIRVGFLVNETAMLYSLSFFETFLTYFNKKKFFVSVYQQYSRPFRETARLQGKASDWRQVYNIDDETLSVIIANDGIDVLIDLCGAAPDGRQPLLLRHPALTQVGWLGFPGGGLPGGVDWLLADSRVAPFDERDSGGICIHALDRPMIAYLGASVDVDPEGEDVLPASRNGFITFGGILDPARIAGSAAVWAEVLRGVPGARLLLGRAVTIDVETRKRIRGLFDRFGVGDRVVFQETPAGKPVSGIFYSSVDILLDTTPVSGTTEICEALWRGVPVVGFLGDRRVGAISASILDAAGRSEWVAADAGQFVALARSLSADIPALAALRRNLPGEIKESPLCDAQGFTTAFEGALVGLVADNRAGNVRARKA